MFAVHTTGPILSIFSPCICHSLNEHETRESITETYNNQCPGMFYFFTNLCSCHLEIEQRIWVQSYVCHAFLLAMVVYLMVLVVACLEIHQVSAQAWMC